MTVAVNDGVLQISDICTVEEAETIANFLQEGLTCVDITDCAHLHTAAFQLLLVAKLPVVGLPASATLTRWVLPMLGASAPAGPDGVTAQSLTRSME